jgi:single-stranded DNA-binding protein
MTARDYVMVSGRLRQRSWETRRGEKRSVTEIEADEVGASLKLATAKVERARCAAPATAAKERQAERGGDFNDAPPFRPTVRRRPCPRLRPGARLVTAQLPLGRNPSVNLASEGLPLRLRLRQVNSD